MTDFETVAVAEERSFAEQELHELTERRRPVDDRCSEPAASCVCGLAKGHEGPHECLDQNRCGGAWSGTWNTDTFTPERFPLMPFFGGVL